MNRREWLAALKRDVARVQAECDAMCMMPLPHRYRHPHTPCACHCALPRGHAGARHKCSVQLAAGSVS